MKARGKRRQLIGTIVSNKMDKSVVIQVERLVKHKLYKKYIRRQTKFAAHDEQNSCGIGDKVLITESRPISRTKRWRVSRIVEKAV
ncbi:MAG: 30S ribosomal protein S17 [Deltaproteobacteria bacterium]|nr:MAG: 30S ribosomal protein S17 [Deltaproteobacteria bacterium]